MNTNAIQTCRRALYEGYEVVVTARRSVTGGFVCDVRRSEQALAWPWTVTAFTTAETHLNYLDPDDKP